MTQRPNRSSKRSPSTSSNQEEIPHAVEPKTSPKTPSKKQSSRTQIRQKQAIAEKAQLAWPTDTELVGLVFDLEATQASLLPVNYTTGLHAWFLQQIREIDPGLSTYLHDGESEKSFNISGLEGPLESRSRQFQLQAGQIYQWSVTAFSKRTVQGLATWLQRLPQELDIRGGNFRIRDVQIALAPMTYAQAWKLPLPEFVSVTLSFLSPTSFRRKQHHLPLPWPRNVFHSYLRRWNDFSEMSVDPESFLDWVDESVLVLRHQLESLKVAAGKQGSVTGFIGCVEFGLTRSALADLEFVKLFWTLGQLAPYLGTGHKTTFGLGQTRLGWLAPQAVQESPVMQTLLAERIAELTDLFVTMKKRQGGDRARKTAEGWATILARRELGDSLEEIAEDLGMQYETVKSYAKLARRALRELEAK